MQDFERNFWLFCIFLAFKHKNVKNAYFDQGLECAAPNRWSKYTTILHSVTGQLFLLKLSLSICWHVLSPKMLLLNCCHKINNQSLYRLEGHIFLYPSQLLFQFNSYVFHIFTNLWGYTSAWQRYSSKNWSTWSKTTVRSKRVFSP